MPATYSRLLYGIVSCRFILQHPGLGRSYILLNKTRVTNYLRIKDICLALKHTEVESIENLVSKYVLVREGIIRPREHGSSESQRDTPREYPPTAKIDQWELTRTSKTMSPGADHTRTLRHHLPQC